MNIEQLKNEATKLSQLLKRFVNDYNELEENTDRTALNEDDLYFFSTLYQAAVKSDDFVRMIEQMNKSIITEGYLKKNHNGRYELNNYELTTGHPLDVWLEDDYYNSGGYWFSTRIEHKNGDYYAVSVSNSLNGLKARIK
ncbi:hypothetical protein DTX80_17780 [Bacilli bacterium]|nr:hypothetical protein WH51_11425 [Bacilli bacterium VT-13-104]PZD83176.1 hypothetical protein DEJ64_16020 [Bacilli bacterium]PZD84288.1 hypothetical protein DEJ60_15040 [Bacilli bacterium]PZD86322.1 hypothetical protein DEJ66_15795 [Bacilli bacterium]RCO04300.1 hypothetical protein DTX80_17780 [Bacilli bacterium]